MNARNRVFLILALLTIGSLIWYFATVRPTGDLQIIGTVDANEVQVSQGLTTEDLVVLNASGAYGLTGQLVDVVLQ